MDETSRAEIASRIFIFCIEPCANHAFDDLVTLFDGALTRLPQPLADIGAALRRNLAAVVYTTTLPWRLAEASVHSRRLNQLHIAERLSILARVPAEQELTPEQEQTVHTRAVEKMELERRDETQSGARTDAMLAELLGLLRGSPLSMAAEELLRQGLVFTWSACEVFANDLFEWLVNHDPSLAGTILRDEGCRKVFQLKAVGLEQLAEHDFDLSGRMGSVLLGQHPLDSVPALRAAYGALFPGDSTLRGALHDPRLWVLWKRRNLLVHRRGIVDRQYLDSTDETCALGSQLVVRPRNIEADLILVRDVAVRMLQAAAASLQDVERPQGGAE